MRKPALLILIVMVACNIGKEDVAFVEESSAGVVDVSSPSRVASVEEGVSFEVSEGKTKRCLSASHWAAFWITCSTCYVNWIKIKPVDIKSRKGKVIKSLKGRLGYSFSITPLKYNNESNKYVMPLIMFESLDSSNSVEVVSFMLTDYLELNFNKRGGTFEIPRVEKSAENPGRNVYPFGILNIGNPSGGEEVIGAIARQYKGGRWESLRAKIRVKVEEKVKVYSITLDAKLFNEFMKEVFARYPDVASENKKFRIPV
ncbi:p23 cell envelope protein (plasmid) [Borrelia turcica IST7]|uniref:p23 cell envelope protein n=1 Tax=Borrelia turcica IST7 TaxID=1104446 RepID=A0A386PRJ9_9SPIR|nr:p23 cell envelope protein [Borrelia turcica]AYE37080.1 p23 cell envelope protein [Borrelia turcica IST7]